MNKLLIRCLWTMPFALLALFFASGYVYPTNRIFAGYGQLLVLIAAVAGYALALREQGKLYGDALSRGKRRFADWARVTLEFCAVVYLSLASEFRESMLHQLLMIAFIALIIADSLRLIWVARVGRNASGSGDPVALD